MQVVVSIVALVAQLLAYGLHLLAQEVFLLRLFHAVPGRTADAHLHAGNGNFVFQLLDDAPQPFNGIQHFQQLLGFLGAHAQVAGNKVSQLPGLVYVPQDSHELRCRDAAQAQDLFGKLAHLPHHGLDFGGDLCLRFVDVFGFCRHEGACSVYVVHPCTGNGLNKGLHLVVRHLQQAQDLDNHACVIQIVRGRLLG